MFEQYKLAVEMADRVSARRATANTFFLSIQTGLAIALGAFAVNDGVQDNANPDSFVLTLAAVAGVLIASSWWMLLRSYRDLNSAKFAVINNLEEKYLRVHLFKDEWEHLKQDRAKAWQRRYAELGQIERLVPSLFALLYLVLAIHVNWRFQ
ncbi:hypothetical protein F6B93_02685 [Mycobacterium spongiae]|uniref:Uncharacterized protein n=2 Tax=Mycobacterium spongiae TaxID=886343 RepID=A0A975K4B4_9MYCO|nr:hypothetical protein F6B93_02685 [Mycobacterium spongiae]